MELHDAEAVLISSASRGILCPEVLSESLTPFGTSSKNFSLSALPSKKASGKLQSLGGPVRGSFFGSLPVHRK